MSDHEVKLIIILKYLLNINFSSFTLLYFKITLLPTGLIQWPLNELISISNNGELTKTI